MSITASAITSGSNSALSALLKAGGASAKAVDVVAKDIADIEKASAASGTQSLSSDSLKTALSSKIDADVASGKLTEKDASAVKQALGLPSQDTSDGSTAQAGASSGAACGSGAKGHGDGDGDHGGGGAAKTEVSRVDTVANGLKTTVITYSDATTDTQTTVTTDPDTKAKNPVEEAYAPDAGSYVKSLEPGSLVQTMA